VQILHISNSAPQLRDSEISAHYMTNKTILLAKYAGRAHQPVTTAVTGSLGGYIRGKKTKLRKLRKPGKKKKKTTKTTKACSEATCSYSTMFYTAVK